MLISVVIPVYNSEATLLVLVARVAAAVHMLGHPWEILLIDDGSSDGSASVMQSLCATYPTLRAYRLAYNCGQQGATLIGLREAKGDVVFTLDDDLQHPPEAFSSMLAALSAEVEMVYAQPTNIFNGARSRAFSRYAKRFLRYGFGMKQAKSFSSYRLVRRGALAPLAQVRGSAFSLDGLMLSASPRIVTVPVRFAERQHGASSYNFMRSLTLLSLIGMSYRFPALTRLRGGRPLPPYEALNARPAPAGEPHI